MSACLFSRTLEVEVLHRVPPHGFQMRAPRTFGLRSFDLTGSHDLTSQWIRGTVLGVT